ncbi:Pkinase-domain-containing protein [Thozetella sp. PMI_491]|nr:Pkinase-domain-containing protein [Thozetella sp. PMI_491]
MTTALSPGGAADVPIRSQSVRTPRRPPTSSRPEPAPRAESSSRVQSSATATATSSRPESSRTAATTAAEPSRRSSQSRSKSQVKYRHVVPAQSGNYEFIKTIGQGSMGKVKLAKNLETGEQVACKIIERVSQDDGRTSKEERDASDKAREIRNAREAALVNVLHHPHICALRDNVRTRWHWYMLFEYVNGGQMLDYIISHGKLKEKNARRFARQIASAVDYCHRNSIVHRDLKIENILISKNNDIKIIDFGLSNLFSPRGDRLKTFCGSLYFAAPELLQAQPYTGPEVDIWSFGVVIYVLVCGKVPFDDQYMPTLHAKIKKGSVDYPNWLSSECKHLISRMLVVDPTKRANMVEVLNHPWMIKGFGAPPENYLPAREPLTLPLDPEVISNMVGFNFGNSDSIEATLTKIIESNRYKEAVRQLEETEVVPPPRDVEKKRAFSSFYRRRNSVTSKDTLTATASTEGLPLGVDPLNAFHPLISIYYLVREKLERDREHDRKEPATPSRTKPPPSPSKPPSASRPEPEPTIEISAPKAAHTNDDTRHRARAHSEDQPRPPIKNGLLSPDMVPVKKEGNMAGLFRRLSTRDRRREPEVKPEIARGSMSMRAKSLGHARRESIQARRAKREAEREQQQPVKEETDAEMSGGAEKPSRAEKGDKGEKSDKSDAEKRNGSRYDSDRQDDERRDRDDRRRESRRTRRDEHEEAIVDDSGSDERLDSAADPDLAKPVFLKGIFSVSTTSTKPLPAIRADIKRVLKQLGISYHEVKGGFMCTYTPSIEQGDDGDIEFEVLVVKVPIVSLHGVQFKRVRGNTWQYKATADQIVKDLRL